MRIASALLLLLYFLFPLSVWGQVLETINNLEKELAFIALHKQKAIKHNELAYILLEIDLAKAYTHTEKALQIAQKQALPAQEAESYWILGQIYCQQQRYSPSHQAFQKALYTFRKERDVLGEQKTCLEVAMLYSRQGLNLKADSILTKVLPILKNSYSQTFFYAYSYYCVGVHTLRKGDQTIAIDNLMSAFRLCEDKYDLLGARIQNAIGLAYKNLGFKRLALEHYLKALKIYDTLGIELRGLTVTLTNVGNLYVHWQDSLHYDVAFKYYKRAQKLAIKYQETEQYIDIMNNLSRMYLAQKKYDFALTYLDSCQLLAQGKVFLLSLAHIKLQRANIYIQTKATAKARRELWEAIALYKKQKSMKDVAICCALLGHSYRQEKDYAQAITYYLKMENLAKEGAFYKELSIAYSHLCHVYFEQKDCQNALQYALKKQDVNEKYHLEPFRPDAWAMLAKADSCQGNYQSALKWYRRYVHYKDSVDREQRYQDTQELQHLYDFENQEKESLALKKQNAWQKRDLTNQLIMLVLACALLVFVGLISFITLYFYRYQKHKNQQIEAHNRELEDANAFKTKLISIIAHDLRRPYTNLIGTLQLIREGVLDTEEQQTLFTAIEKQTTRTHEFINNLLLWAKAQQNAFKFQPMLFDVRLLIHHVLELLKHQAEEKEVYFCSDMGQEQEMYAYADMEMMKIVVFNLVTNAVKFTPQKGNICITQEIENNFAYIRIKDTGVGISPENQRKLLEKRNFYTSGTAGESGFGLGLMICYDFVAMNNGELSFESKVGEGTTFIIALPTQAEDA
ncbi:MAG: hypothetical protein EAZ95_08955 [Bacteroidetes bacterium]|nr:MAG: hypothetical protein EAZ95_08955 [Bacteroidota bacterium]